MDLIHSKFESYLFIFTILLISLNTSDGFKSIANNKDYIYVITLDGTLYEIEQYTGEIRWTIKENTILNNIPISKSFSYENPYFLIDPNDGGLYIFTNQIDGLKKFPYTIPQLVNSSPAKTLDGLLFTGDKKDEWFVIDRENGIKIDSLKSETYASKISNKNDESFLLIGRTKYTINMFDITSREKLYNLSYYDYSTHEKFIDTKNFDPTENDNYKFYHFSSSSDGTLLTMDRTNGDLLWKLKLDSTIVSMYKYQNEHQLQKIEFNVFSKKELNYVNYLYNNIKSLKNPSKEIIDTKVTSEKIKEEPLTKMLYIGSFKNNFYVLSTHVFDWKFNIESDEKQKTNELAEINSILIGHHKIPEKLHLPSNYIQSNRKFILVSEYDDDLKFYINSLQGNDLCLAHDENNLNLNENDILNANYSLEHLYIILVISILVIVISYKILKNKKYNKKTTSNKSKLSKNKTNSSNIIKLNSKSEYLNNELVKIGKLTFNPKEVIGYGCSGTIVYKGKFENRKIALKRLLSECFSLADKEVDLLKDADQHPNVIRYFCTESDNQFKYIAIELCQMTLSDHINAIRSGENSKLNFNSLSLLRQATLGLSHLHMLGIVHRDIKPQNILISFPDHRGIIRAMISDFGLSKRLVLGNHSFTKKSSIIGTDGWIAPEMMISNNIDDQFKRVTKAVDIFSLGCVYYFTLSNGYHPFGNMFLRQANILKNIYKLDKLTSNSNCDSYMQRLLIEEIISHNPINRPNIKQILCHPTFWSKAKILQFLQDVSDRLERVDQNDNLILNLEKNANVIIKNNWKSHICIHLQNDLKKFRSYNGLSVCDLLRAIRNKKHHYRETDEELKKSLGQLPGQFVDYFIIRFPKLLLHVYNVMKACQTESMLSIYYNFETHHF